MPDENDDTAASVRGITRKNARPGEGAIRTQSRESRNPGRGRRIEIGFPDIDKVNRMGQKKVKQFSVHGSKTSSIPLKNPERVRESRSKGEEGQPGARDGGEGENTKWEEGDKKFEDDNGEGVQH